MIILGLDPGLATTGFALLEYSGSKFKVLNYGVISTPASQPFEARLACIHDDLRQLFIHYDISQVAIEELFFNKNVKTAISVAHARGVMILVAQSYSAQIASYTPPQVKSSVCGYGKAEKKQVQYMVKQLLNLETIPKPDDAADALALAICHAHSYKYSKAKVS